MSDSLTALAAWLRAGAARPFAWGECDCCLFVCDWILQRAGVDPALRWRGHYRSLRGAARLIRAEGGFARMVACGMADAGLRPTRDPQPGDAGLVATQQGPALALRTVTGWACKSEAGIVVAPFVLEAAWSV